VGKARVCLIGKAPAVVLEFGGGGGGGGGLVNEFSCHVKNCIVTQVLLLQAERTKERFKQVLIFLFSLAFFYKYGTCHLSKKEI
jgi:hypothetical protein